MATALVAIFIPLGLQTGAPYATTGAALPVNADRPVGYPAGR
jgi:hypothetical protein